MKTEAEIREYSEELLEAMKAGEPGTDAHFVSWVILYHLSWMIGDDPEADARIEKNRKCLK